MNHEPLPAQGPVDVNVSHRTYLRAPAGCASFQDTFRCCELATNLNVVVVCEILGKDRYFTPNMNPHNVYDFNNNLIGEELLATKTANYNSAP